MSETIELTFENVPETLFEKLIQTITLHAKPEKIFTSEDGDAIYIAGESISETIRRLKPPTALFFIFERVRIGTIEIKKPLIRILLLEKENELNLIFNDNDIKGDSEKSTTQQLAIATKQLAFENNIEIYYCGLEPANDTNTQFFSNSKTGIGGPS